MISSVLVMRAKFVITVPFAVPLSIFAINVTVPDTPPGNVPIFQANLPFGDGVLENEPPPDAVPATYVTFDGSVSDITTFVAVPPPEAFEYEMV